MSRIQHLEPIMRDVLKVRPTSYYVKLQVHPLAHQKMPGDFLFLTPKTNYIIECKECKGTSFAFLRYTQQKEMEKFSNALWNSRSFLVICFWKGTRKKSNFYCIEDWRMNIIMQKSKKKSVNENDLRIYLNTYEELKTIKWLN